LQCEVGISKCVHSLENTNYQGFKHRSKHFSLYRETSIYQYQYGSSVLVWFI